MINMAGVREIAARAGEEFEKLTSFSADQEITAGGLRVTGKVKFRKPRSVVVEYEEYENPIEDFEVEVSGGPEFSGDDLEDSRLIYRGSETWVHLIDKNTAIKKDGKWLYSPFAGVEVVGQLNFLPSLVSDFLLKDDGEGEINGRPVDRLSLKPKQARRSLFLKDEVFNLTKAELAIDRELGLPLKITYYPGEGDQLRFSSSRGGPVHVEYSNYDIDGPGSRDFNFDSTKVDRVFEENLVGKEEFSDRFPVSIPFSSINEHGFELATEDLSLFLDEDNERAYSSLVFVAADEKPGQRTRSLQLLAGNYLSREMTRHRAFLSENGEEIDLDGQSAQTTDRGERVRNQLPEEWDREIHEIGWQKEESFYYLLGQGLERRELLEIARDFSEETKSIVTP